jgi:hypothetical protein
MSMLKRKWNQQSSSKKTVSKKQVRFGSFIFFFSIFILFSCSNDEETQPLILSEILETYALSQLDEVIACAASKKDDSSVTFVYYYPIPEATNIQYYETVDVNVDPNDFSNYRQKTLSSEEIFGGYLSRFIRSGNDEVFCIVTFQTDGKFHKSNPIRLKNNTKPTEYNNAVNIDQSQSLMPLFSWDDGVFPDNEIYFQVISDENNDFISGTYTLDKWFQYYNVSNVVLDINREVPENLMLNQEYNFSMLAVSLDNWVNLVIEKPFAVQ